MVIKLSKGQSALIDEIDYERVLNFRWYLNKMGYAANDSGIRKTMHRFILGFPEKNIDHINGDKLDNRRSNLRLCTQSGNTVNGKKRNTNTSGFKGVSWDKRSNRWIVHTTKDYKHVYGGAFTNKTQAAKRYEELARKLHGDFVRV